MSNPIGDRLPSSLIFFDPTIPKSRAELLRALSDRSGQDRTVVLVRPGDVVRFDQPASFTAEAREMHVEFPPEMLEAMGMPPKEPRPYLGKRHPAQRGDRTVEAFDGPGNRARRRMMMRRGR